MMEKEQPRDNSAMLHTIKGTPYDIDEVYFEKIMQDLGHFLCKRYNKVDVVSPLEVMSQVAYINDLTIQQKMFFSFWIGTHLKDHDYEGYILQCLKKDEI
jgi:hypothetical protein